MSHSTKFKGTAAATAATARDLDKTYDLARRYLEGIGVIKNEARGITLLEQLVAQGHAGAQCELGVCLDKGRGVTQDLVRSAALYNLAAGQGHAGAQFNLGVCYALSAGVVKD